LCVNDILEFKQIEEFAKWIIENEDERCKFAYSTLINIYLLSDTKENINLALQVI